VFRLPGSPGEPETLSSNAVTLDEATERLAERIREHPRITVLTGAGVSAASGIPTFRGAGGLWEDFRLEDLATPGGFAKNPKRVWEWYAWRRRCAAAARPNRAHEVIAAWSRRYDRFALVTQNVDGLHERAGTSDVVRFHGSIWEVGCFAECGGGPRRWADETLDFPELPPPCPRCGGPLRPGVVWFGEPIDMEVLAASLAATECDLCLAIGTSAIVYPAAALLGEAAARGAFTVEINPEATAASAAVDLALPGPAEQVLDRLEALVG
jgi:NAD-dependent deacetylase